jgi:ABC-type lipoprotein export system ATPase subunit
MADSKWMIETRNLTRIYGNGDEVRALDGVNLCVAPGEFMAVMGASGSGKSTLLNLLGALDKPTGGEVYINGQDLAKIRDKDAFRAKTVGFVFQLHNLLPTLTALENVEIPMMGYANPRQRRERAEELLKMVGLANRNKHLPGQLSGGQRQRVAVARSLANQPQLILADEPTGNLDTANGQDLMKLLGELNREQGITFVVVTHDPSVARQTRRVIVMADGKVIREDVIGSALEEDLKVLIHSGLGQRIEAGDETLMGELGIDVSQLSALRRLVALRD